MREPDNTRTGITAREQQNHEQYSLDTSFLCTQTLAFASMSAVAGTYIAGDLDKDYELKITHGVAAATALAGGSNNFFNILHNADGQCSIFKSARAWTALLHTSSSLGIIFTFGSLQETDIERLEPVKLALTATLATYALTIAGTIFDEAAGRISKFIRDRASRNNEEEMEVRDVEAFVIGAARNLDRTGHSIPSAAPGEIREVPLRTITPHQPPRPLASTAEISSGDGWAGRQEPTTYFIA